MVTPEQFEGNTFHKFTRTLVPIWDISGAAQNVDVRYALIIAPKLSDQINICLFKIAHFGRLRIAGTWRFSDSVAWSGNGSSCGSVGSVVWTGDVEIDDDGFLTAER
jgi:hypothetical protein